MLAATLLLGAIATLPGCGYALAGRGSFLPSYIRTIGIPTFTNRTTIFNLAVADTKRVAVFEVTPRRVCEVSAAEGTCVCTNHFRLEAHRPLWSFNVYKTFDRERTLRKMERGCERFGVAEVHAGLHATH